MSKIGPWSISALLLTLILLFAFQGEAILKQPLIIGLLAIPILIQVFFNSSLAYWLNKRVGRLRIGYGPGHGGGRAERGAGDVAGGACGQCQQGLVWGQTVISVSRTMCPAAVRPRRAAG